MIAVCPTTVITPAAAAVERVRAYLIVTARQADRRGAAGRNEPTAEEIREIRLTVEFVRDVQSALCFVYIDQSG